MRRLIAVDARLAPGDELRHAVGMILLGMDQLAIGIRRRQFVSALGSASAAWPFAGIGVLNLLTSAAGGRQADV
jgi:hypothetical protein